MPAATDAGPIHRLARSDPSGCRWYLVGRSDDATEWAWSTDPGRAAPLSRAQAEELELEYNTMPEPSREGAAIAEPATRHWQ